jgi:hypothetical protein
VDVAERDAMNAPYLPAAAATPQGRSGAVANRSPVSSMNVGTKSKICGTVWAYGYPASASAKRRGRRVLIPTPATCHNAPCEVARHDRNDSYQQTLTAFPPGHGVVLSHAMGWASCPAPISFSATSRASSTCSASSAPNVASAGEIFGCLAGRLFRHECTRLGLDADEAIKSPPKCHHSAGRTRCHASDTVTNDSLWCPPWGNPSPSSFLGRGARGRSR